MAPPTRDALVFRPRSGLGDRLLDVTGFVALCRRLGRRPVVEWKVQPENAAWGVGVFDRGLFDFGGGLEVVPDGCGGGHPRVVAPDMAVSLSPLRLYQFLEAISAGSATHPQGDWDRQQQQDAALVRLSAECIKAAREAIRPSPEVWRRMPFRDPAVWQQPGTVAVHLRRTDKITSTGNPRHETTPLEYRRIMADLSAWLDKYVDQYVEQADQYVDQYVDKGADREAVPRDKVLLLLCSEDAAYRDMFAQKLRQRHGARVSILQPDYGPAPGAAAPPDGLGAVLDLFCMSRCEHILQGVKFSTLSTLAAVLGGSTLHNFSASTDTLLQLWRPCVTLQRPSPPPSYRELRSREPSDRELRSREPSDIFNARPDVPGGPVRADLMAAAAMPYGMARIERPHDLTAAAHIYPGPPTPSLPSAPHHRQPPHQPLRYVRPQGVVRVGAPSNGVPPWGMARSVQQYNGRGV
jgi:hypothetical protein